MRVFVFIFAFVGRLVDGNPGLLVPGPRMLRYASLWRELGTSTETSLLNALPLNAAAPLLDIPFFYINDHAQPR